MQKRKGLELDRPVNLPANEPCNRPRPEEIGGTPHTHRHYTPRPGKKKHFLPALDGEKRSPAPRPGGLRQGGGGQSLGRSGRRRAARPPSSPAGARPVPQSLAY